MIAEDQKNMTTQWWSTGRHVWALLLVIEANLITKDFFMELTWHTFFCNQRCIKNSSVIFTDTFDILIGQTHCVKWICIYLQLWQRNVILTSSCNCISLFFTFNCTLDRTYITSLVRISRITVSCLYGKRYWAVQGRWYLNK